MIKLLKKRRSIRRYTDQTIENEKIETILKAGLLAPTSKNLYSWEFIAISDHDILEKLSNSRDNGAAKFIKGAPLGIVIMGDETVTDAWIEDASIAASFIQLEVAHLGLGSCWIQVRNRMYDEKTTTEEYIKNILNIPSKFKVECILSIGYPDEIKKEHDELNLKFEKVHFNKL